MPEYIFNFLKVMHNIKMTDVMQSQTNGIRNLIIDEFFNQLIPVPSIEKQYEIVENIKIIRETIKQLNREAYQILESTEQQIEEIILGE